MLRLFCWVGEVGSGRSIQPPLVVGEDGGEDIFRILFKRWDPRNSPVYVVFLRYDRYYHEGD